MSNPDFAIYRSDHPAVLTTWEQHVAAQAAWEARMTEQMHAWGFHHTNVVVSRSAWTTRTLLGVAHDTLPPQGWRRDGQQSPKRIVPYAREKVLSAEFNALREVPDVRRGLIMLGMPQHMFVGLTVTAPEIDLVSDVVWVKWHGCDPLASATWWTKIKLSKYYAMVEAGADPFAADKSVDAES